jgi:DNA-binding LacI/PurR family transcriptional regulator
MPTIVEVAQRAGVAVSTVSYALSGKRPVSAATRQRIQNAIDELGFHPNFLARGLASKRTRVISLLFPTVMRDRILSDVQFEFVAGVTNVASDKGYGLLLWTTPNEEHQIDRLIQEGLAGGVILMEVKLEDARVDLLRERQFPFALIGHCLNCDDLYYVDFDFSEGMRMALRHLAERGHHHVAFINFDQDLLDAGYGPAVRSRNGFEHGLAENGLQGYMSADSRTVQKAASSFHRLLEAHPQVSAVVIANELIAAGVTRFVYEIGMRIPDDLSVIVIASDVAAERMTPPLTNIVLPAAHMGRIGAELLIGQLEGEIVEPRNRNMLLPARLTEHGSTRAVGQLERSDGVDRAVAHPEGGGAIPISRA